MRSLGVTGIIGSGKSTVCRLLEAEGAYVVSADAIVHELLSTDQAVRERVLESFGEAILTDGQIDRTKLAERVFKQPEQLRTLEGILHPAVGEALGLHFRAASEEAGDAKLFVAEIPLLFEAHMEELFDQTVVVKAPEDQCLARFINATGNDAEEYSRRVAEQYSQEEKIARADIVLDNSGDLESLTQQVKSLYQSQLSEDKTQNDNNQK